MSKAVRIRDYLYEEVDRLAKTEKRSLIAQLEVLLEQALQLPENFNKSKIAPATDEPREAIEVALGETAELETETPRKKKRMYPCKHHFPASKHCTFGCDD